MTRVSKEIVLVLLGTGAVGTASVITPDDDTQPIAQAAAEKQTGIGSTTHRGPMFHFLPIYLGGGNSSQRMVKAPMNVASALPRGGFGSIGRGFAAGS